MGIPVLVMVNRLFTQSRRMQIFCLKDLLLSQEQINSFDRAMEMKVSPDAEKSVSWADS